MSELEHTDGTIHVQSVSNLEDGNNYVYFVLCKDPSGNISEKGTISFSVSTFVLQSGADLYRPYCSGCHNSLEFTEYPNASVSQIKSAINRVGNMRSLSVLRDEEIQAISDAMQSN